METNSKIQKCLRTKVLYVKSISVRKLEAFNKLGFTVILKAPKRYWEKYEVEAAK